MYGTYYKLKPKFLLVISNFPALRTAAKIFVFKVVAIFGKSTAGN